ncbi:MAG: DUF4301 family protein [Muribaculaceae bacterium]|nr:DUF4301 family protein [Muribaculaceae bacterium]
MLNQNDLAQIAGKGVSAETVEKQLKQFSTGFPYLKLAGSATIGHGIIKLSSEQEEEAIARWKKYLSDGGEVMKFVPASGAASRMFKALFSFVDGEEDTPKPGSPVAELLAHIEETPFYDELSDVCKRLYNKSIAELIDENRAKDVIAAIIRPEGLNYGQLPKALLTFHKYNDGVRTSLEEQLIEGAQTAAANGKVRLHFTVSADHRKLFEKKISEVLPAIEAKTGLKFDISMSEQKPSTDTVAATVDNELFRDDNGKLVFRPGGHGALIENLNDIDSAVVFIKNIDNVVPDSRRTETIRYKQIIGGTLILVHDRIEKYLESIHTGCYTPSELKEMADFLHTTLSIEDKRLNTLTGRALAEYIKEKLNRPLRVCGMVRNEGEPGGGPFIAVNPDGSASPQILESTQIDPKSESAQAMMKSATHFNPVDLVCYLKRPDGSAYYLPDYVDHNTGFISSKSFAGRELKALELPGLWNGAMSDWSTVFVEVPAETFNPVKTVNDLLRPAHQQ